MTLNVDDPKSSERRGLLYKLFKHQLPLESETCLFIFMNALDFFVTYYMLYFHIAKESNPIANWFLEGWGVMKGLLMYKLALVTLVCGIAQIVATQKPHTARWLLIGSSVVIFAVVVYSLRMIFNHVGSGGSEEFEFALLGLFQ